MKTQTKSMSHVIHAAAAVFFAFAATAAFATDPNTWWVDDACYGAAVQDGSEDHPFGTILAAITNSACVSGDTIKVKPGVYDKDYDERTETMSSTGYQMRSRRLLRAGRSCAISVIHDKGRTVPLLIS